MFKAWFYLLLFLPVAGWAEDISILGLFKDRVVLQVDGKPSILKVGQKTSQGFKLLQASSREAILLVDGKEQAFQLGMQIQTSFNAPQSATVHIARDQHGMYRVEGRVNKMPVHFLVDTGASMLSLNSDQADAMNLSYKEG